MFNEMPQFCTLSELADFLKNKKNATATIEEAKAFGMSDAMLNTLRSNHGKGPISIVGDTLTIAIDTTHRPPSPQEMCDFGVLNRYHQHFIPNDVPLASLLSNPTNSTERQESTSVWDPSRILTALIPAILSGQLHCENHTGYSYDFHTRYQLFAERLLRKLHFACVHAGGYRSSELWSNFIDAIKGIFLPHGVLNDLFSTFLYRADYLQPPEIVFRPIY